ncbi:MAG: phosphohistidine phosphatase SixA [Planctomycetota bacterium]|jgi:phosphohistidine phosphatase
MKLYLVQHAKATGKEVDPERSLTDEGINEAKLIANFAENMELSAGYLWHSGKKRAVQTAQILTNAICIENASIAQDGLGPNDDVRKIENELNSGEQDVMIVGHMPFLSKLASKLLCGEERAETVIFKNAGIVCLVRDEERGWHLDWLVTPDLLSKNI